MREKALLDLKACFSPLLILAVGVGLYANSLSNPFVFDDLEIIVDNPDIRSLWPPTWARVTVLPHASVNGRLRPPCRGAQPAQQIATGRSNDLGGGSWCGSASIGDQIGDRDIDLVANSADHRDSGCGDGPRHAFVVECPQVFT